MRSVATEKRTPKAKKVVNKEERKERRVETGKGDGEEAHPRAGFGNFLKQRGRKGETKKKEPQGRTMGFILIPSRVAKRVLWPFVRVQR
jgi:hypothetical protein